jgi:hypothetical protein
MTCRPGYTAARGRSISLTALGVGARNKTAQERGTVPICSADYANLGQSPAVLFGRAASCRFATPASKLSGPTASFWGANSRNHLENARHALPVVMACHPPARNAERQQQETAEAAERRAKRAGLVSGTLRPPVQGPCMGSCGKETLSPLPGLKTARRGGQSQFALRTTQIRDSPRGFGLECRTDLAGR